MFVVAILEMRILIVINGANGRLLTVSNGKIHTYFEERMSWLNKYFHQQFRYDPVKKIWTTVTPMINKRSKFSLYVTGNNRMYAVGGTDEPKYKDYPEDVDELLIEFYDSKNNEWTTIAKVSKNCDTFWDRLPNVSFVFNNSLHTFFKTAGYPNYLRTGVLKYDEHSNSWIMVKRLSFLLWIMN